MEYPPSKKLRLMGTSSNSPDSSPSPLSTSETEREDFADFLSPPTTTIHREGYHSQHLRSRRGHLELHRQRLATRRLPIPQLRERRIPSLEASDGAAGNDGLRLDSRTPQSGVNAPPAAQQPAAPDVPGLNAAPTDVPLIPLVLSAAGIQASESPELFTGVRAPEQTGFSLTSIHPLSAITNIPISYVIGTPSSSSRPTPTTLSSSTRSSVITRSSTTTRSTTTSSPRPTLTRSSLTTTSPLSTSSQTLTTPEASQSSLSTTSEPASTTTAVPGAAGANEANGQSSNGGSSPTPKIVGGVVGGVAGLVIVLLLALLLLRYLKRRKYGPARGLREGTPEPGLEPPMEEAPSAGGFGIMKRLSRPRSDAPVPPAERGFERLSGRKLPSQFSPGMEGPTREPGSSTATYPSGTSAYPSGGTFLTDATDAPLNAPPGSSPTPPPDSPGVATRAALAALSSGGQHVETNVPGSGPLRPSPAHTPRLQQGEVGRAPSQLAPISRASPTPHTPSFAGHTPPLSPLRPTLGRSHPSFDGSRGSRFLEDIG